MPTTAISAMTSQGQSPPPAPVRSLHASLVQEREDSYGGSMVKVLSGGSVEFTGELTATGLDNIRSVFFIEVDGSIE